QPVCEEVLPHARLMIIPVIASPPVANVCHGYAAALGNERCAALGQPVDRAGVWLGVVNGPGHALQVAMLVEVPQPLAGAVGIGASVGEKQVLDLPALQHPVPVDRLNDCNVALS